MTTTADAPRVETDALDPDDFALIPTESIRRAEENRTVVDDEDFRALVENIRDIGILSPLLVRPLGDKTYELIAGERRWTAAREIGLETVPAFLLDYNEDADRLTVMIAENLHRRNLSTMEQARHVGILADLGLSQRDIAERLRVSQPQVSKLHSLLKLPPKAQEWMDAGELTQADAVKLAGLPKDKRDELCKGQRVSTWDIDNAHRRAEHEKEVAKVTKQAKAKGWTVLDEHPGWEREDDEPDHPLLLDRDRHDPYGDLAHVDPTEHETEPCHAIWLNGNAVLAACTEPSRHPQPEGWKSPAETEDEESDEDDGPLQSRAARQERAQVARHERDAERAEAMAYRLKLLDPVVDACRKAIEVASCDGYQDAALRYAAQRILVDEDVFTACPEAARLLDVDEGDRIGWGASGAAMAAFVTTPGAPEDAGFRTLYGWGLATALYRLGLLIDASVDGREFDDDDWIEIAIVKQMLAHVGDMADIEVPTLESIIGDLSGEGDTEADEDTEDEAEPAPQLGTPLPHARCSVCGGNFAVRKNGTMREHRGLGAVGDDGAEVCAGSALLPAGSEPPSDAEGVATVTFSTKGTRVVRTCSVHGKLGTSATRMNAGVMATKHFKDEHGGKGVVQDELGGGVELVSDPLKVAGRCPMGCGDTLFLADGGYVTCSYKPCPRPTAVADLLEDRETEHIVVFDEDGFIVRHPLRERLDDELLDCKLHAFCAELSGPPAQLGRYRVTRTDLPGAGDWRFRKVAP